MYGSISTINVVGKNIFRDIVNRVHRVAEGLTDDNHEGFRSGKGCLD